MPQRVVDEVRERLLGAQPVGVDDEAVGALDAQLAAGLGRARLETPGGGREQLAHVEPLGADGKPALVRPGEDEQVLGELHEPVALAGRRGHRLAELLGRAALA